MLCCLPFCAKDVDRLLDLLEWCAQLGHQNHPSLLIADPDVPWDKAVKALDLAQKAFNSAEMVSIDTHIEGWIAGSCALFKLAAIEAKTRNTPFLFMEPDAVPLKPTWMDELESAYGRSGKPFMGVLVSHQTKGLPSPYLEGIAVYPANTIDIVMPVWKPNQSWTLACASAVVPLSTTTPLIKHVWGEKDKPSPTFAENNVPGTHIFCLRNIPPEAVIWHRCKDASLIRLLRKRAGINSHSIELLTVLAFCGRDHQLMLKSLRWMAEIHGQLDRTAILHYDASVPPPASDTAMFLAKQCFKNVQNNRIQQPRRPFIGWPGTANWSFRKACDITSRYGKSWIWFEADIVALTPNWLSVLEDEYASSGKQFMGHIVRPFDGWQAGHMNGTGVYPPNAASHIPQALSKANYPFDAGMREEMIHLCHPANHLIQHCGAVVDGCCKPAQGPQARFPDQETVNRLIQPKTVVLFHPDKTGTLIDRLRELRH